MLRYKFAGIRALMDVTIYFLLYLSYQYGVILGERIFGFDYWFIDFVYGAITAACANYLISLVKKYIFLIFKCGTIWSICNPEDTSIIAVLQKVTCDWKETFSIPMKCYLRLKRQRNGDLKQSDWLRRVTLKRLRP